MQDEYGRPLSDDGQWVWDGSGWRATAAGLPQNPQNPASPAGTGDEPTQVGYPDAAISSQDYFAGAAPYAPGSPPPPTPWWKRPVVIIGALLVLAAVLITILVLTRGDGNKTPATPSLLPTPSVTQSVSPAPTTEPPTTPPAAPTTEPPTTPPAAPTPPPDTPPPDTPPPDTPPPTPVPTALVPSQVKPGIYECTQGGQKTGTISFAGLSYTTDTGAVGTYAYTVSTGAISFTGGDLGPYTGTYNPAGPSMDVVASGNRLHCAQ